MITRFTTADNAVEEAEYRAATELKAQAICRDPVGFRVLPLADIRSRSAAIEIVRPMFEVIIKNVEMLA